MSFSNGGSFVCSRCLESAKGAAAPSAALLYRHRFGTINLLLGSNIAGSRDTSQRGERMAWAKIDRSEFSPDDWRGLARHLRELALAIMDDRTRARMNKQAQDYELTADRLDSAGVAPVPRQKPEGLAWATDFGFGGATLPKLRLFRRMWAWRPRAAKRQRQALFNRHPDSTTFCAASMFRHTNQRHGTKLRSARSLVGRARDLQGRKAMVGRGN
jgi:hypothetical protein